jgi:hypothetical protein
MAMKRHTWFTYASREHYVDGRGINKGWWITHQSLGRENTKTSPYLIANEWICGNLAQILRLPIPPFALMRRGKRNAVRMFASLRFTSGDEAPDDIDAEACIRADASLCTGITLFDAFVMNPDRHEGNLAVDDQTSPRSIYVFDHDRALFGARKNKGMERLKNNAEKLVFSGRRGTASPSHCLALKINTAAFFGKWLEKIEMIPSWFIQDICHHDIGITREMADCAIETLDSRKKNLATIIRANRSKFPLIKDWTLLQ